MEICEITGNKKSVIIEYFFGEQSLGKTLTSEGSTPEARIRDAKILGVDYYDRFVLDNGRLDTKDVKMLYNGEIGQQNDFKKCDPSEFGINKEGDVVKNPDYKPCQ